MRYDLPAIIEAPAMDHQMKPETQNTSGAEVHGGLQPVPLIDGVL